MSEFERKVSRNLQCPVCFELLCDPKQLSCTHTFCKKCLNDILKSSSKNYLTCPICRSVTSVAGGNVLNLITNVPLKSLIDDVRNSQQVCEMCDSNPRAVHICCECGKNMCNTCLDIHNKWPLNGKHRVVRVEDVREGRVVIEKEVYCQEHKADEQKYICTDVCITCKKLICLRCRMLYHDKKGHTVQDAKEYNASTKAQLESLQARGKTKVTTIKNHVTCIKTQKKRVTDHIACRKAEINKQLDAQEEKLCKRLDEMQDLDERLIASIESASVLVGNSIKAPLEDNTIVIRDTLSGELNDVLGRDDPENKLATDVADRAEQLICIPKCQLKFGQLQKTAVRIGIGFLVCLVVVTCLLFTPNNDPEKNLGTELADRAEQLILTPNNQRNQSNIGEVRVVKCMSVCDVELSKKDCLNGMAATPDGGMAVVYSTGGIDILSADGQLQKTVLKDVDIRDIGYLSDGRYVVGTIKNDITMYTEESQKLDVQFDTLSIDGSGINSLTVDSNNLIYVGYWRAKKILVFSPAGGKAIRKISTFYWYPRLPVKITIHNDLLIAESGEGVLIIDKNGDVKHQVRRSNFYPHAAVTQNNSILIAWIKHDRGLVSIDKYTSDLKHIQTLISDHKIEKRETNWYYLREFRSGEIAFCTPDRLYIFNLLSHHEVHE